jgi:predicted Zn-dependent protease
MLTLQTSTQSPEAINRHWQKLRQLYPQRQSIWLRYADHLLDTQQAERLITELGKAQDQDTMTFEQWSRLAKAYHAQADETASAWALSRAYGSIGHLKLSRTQLHRAEQQNANRTSWLKTQLENQANWLENQEKLRKGLE